MGYEMRKKHVFLSALIAICLIAVSGLSACAFNRGGGDPAPEPTPPAETVELDWRASKFQSPQHVTYNDTYTLESTVPDTKGKSYELTYVVTNSSGTTITPISGTFTATAQSYTIVYTALVAEDNKPTRTVELIVDTNEPTVIVPEVGNGIVDVEMTLPAATYMEARNEGGITEYKLWYLGEDGESDPEDVTADIVSADPEATLKNGGTFTPKQAGTYKIVAKGSKAGGEDELTAEREFKVMAVDEHKPYNFSDEMIDVFLNDNLTSIVAVTNDMTTEAPDGAPTEGAKVLKTTWTNATTGKEVGKISALPLEIALSRLEADGTDLQESILRYWVYNPGDEAINAAYNFVGADGTKVALDERAVPAGQWAKYEISLLKLCGPNGFNCEVGELADKLRSTAQTSYLAFSVSGTEGTLYTSDITISQADDYNIAENTLVDFGQDLTKYLLLYGNAQEVSVVEASGEITAPFNDEHNTDNKVLKIVGNTTTDGLELGGIDGAIIKAALNKYSYNLTDKFIAFKYYVSGPADSDIRVGMRWYNGTTQKDLNTPDLYIGIWKEAKFSIGEIGAPDTLKDEIDKLMFVPKVNSTDDITVYVSNIYIEGNTTPDINEYTPTQGKLVDFNQTAIKNFIQVGGAKTVDVVDPTSRPGTKPFDGDANVLKIEGSTFTANDDRDLGRIDGAIVKKALEEYAKAGDLAGKYIRFKYYVDPGTASNINISMRWWKDSEQSVELSLGTIATEAWTTASWKMEEVGVALEALKDNIDHLSFYAKTPDGGSNITLYISSIYIYDPLANYEADKGKLVDFGGTFDKDYILQTSDATSVELVNAETEEIGLPDKKNYGNDKTVLKVTGTTGTYEDWNEIGYIDGAVIKKALEQYDNGALTGKYIRFMYYVDSSCSATDIRINLFWNKQKESTVATRGSLGCTGIKPGEWNTFYFKIATGTPLADVNPDNLKDNIDHLSFYTLTEDRSDITFYVSNIYIEDPEGEHDKAETGTLVDFKQKYFEEYWLGANGNESVSIVDVADEEAIVGTKLPFSNHSADNNVLKIEADLTNDDDGWENFGRIDGTIIKNALEKYLKEIGDTSLDTGRVITFRYYVASCSAPDIRINMRWYKDEKEAKNSLNAENLYTEVWKTVSFPINGNGDPVIGTPDTGSYESTGQPHGNLNGVKPDELKDNINRLTFFTYANPKGPITFYVSNIYVETAPDINEYDPGEGKLVDFDKDAIKNFIQVGAAKTAEVVDAESAGIGKPFGDTYPQDKMVLKITGSNVGYNWRDLGYIDGAVVKKALEQYAGDLTGKYIRFKYYIVDADKNPQINLRWWKDDTTARNSIDSGKISATGWKEFSSLIRDIDPVIGNAASDETGNLNGVKPDQLKDNINHLSFYTHTDPNSDITFYVSSIYIYDPIPDYTADKGKLVDFGGTFDQGKILQQTNATVSIVDATTEPAGGNKIDKPYADKPDTKVLKVVGSGERSNGWLDCGGIDGAIVRKVLGLYGPGELENKVLKLKYFVTTDCASLDIRINLRWWKDGSTKTSIECKGIATGQWQEFYVPLTEFNGVALDDLKNQTDHLSFFTDTVPDSDMTFYVSNIYIEDASANEYTVNKEKPYDFSQEGGIRQYLKSTTTTVSSIVKASTANAADTPEGAPSGDDKVLRYRWTVKESGKWNTYIAFDTIPLQNALGQLGENELKNAVMSYWTYNDSDWAYSAALLIRDKEDKNNMGRNTVVCTKKWTKVTIGVDALSNMYNCRPSELKDKIGNFAFYMSGYDASKKKGDATGFPATGTEFDLYISDISLDIHSYEAGDGKLIDFTQENVVGFLSSGISTNIEMPEVVEVGSVGNEVTTLPFADNATDNKALKIKFKKTGYQHTGYIFASSTIFQDALRKYSPQDLAKATLKFKIYATNNGGMTINFYNKELSGDLADTNNRKKCTNYKVTTNGSTQAMSKNGWLEVSVGIGEGMGKYTSSNLYANGEAYTTLLGGDTTTNPAFGSCTAETLADNFGGIGIFWNAKSVGDTIYISDIYIEIAE